MKKIIFNYSMILLLTSLVTLPGCKDDDELSKADYIGSYMVSEVCDGVTYSYTFSIADVSGSDDVVTIFNLWDWEEVMDATVDDNTFTLASQISDEVAFSGSGNFSDNVLVITYTATDDSVAQNCVATGTKQ